MLTVPLEKISLCKLLNGDKAEAERVFNVCTTTILRVARLGGALAIFASSAKNALSNTSMEENLVPAL